MLFRLFLKRTVVLAGNSLVALYATGLLLSGVVCSGPVRNAPDCRVKYTLQSFLERANHLREVQDIEPLESDPALSEQAVMMAEYNIKQGQITHYDAKGNGPLDRIKRAGLNRRMVAENIAAVPASVSLEKVLESWKGKKEGENLLNPLYHLAGYGVSGGQSGCMIVLVLTE